MSCRVTAKKEKKSRLSNKICWMMIIHLANLLGPVHIRAGKNSQIMLARKVEYLTHGRPGTLSATPLYSRLIVIASRFAPPPPAPLSSLQTDIEAFWQSL